MSKKILKSELSSSEYYQTGQNKYLSNLLELNPEDFMLCSASTEKFARNLRDFYSYRILSNPYHLVARSQALKNIAAEGLIDDILTQTRKIENNGRKFKKRKFKLNSESCPWCALIKKFKQGYSQTDGISFQTRNSVTGAHLWFHIIAFKLFRFINTNIRQKHKRLGPRNREYKRQPEYDILAGSLRFTKVGFCAFLELLEEILPSEVQRASIDKVDYIRFEAADRLFLNQVQLRTFVEKIPALGNGQIPFYNVVSEPAADYKSESPIEIFLVKNNQQLTLKNTVGNYRNHHEIDLTDALVRSTGVITSTDNLYTFGDFYNSDDFYIGPQGTLISPRLGDRKQAIVVEDLEPALEISLDDAFNLTSMGNGNYWHSLIENLPRILEVGDINNIIWDFRAPKELTRFLYGICTKKKIHNFIEGKNYLIRELRSLPLAIVSKEPLLTNPQNISIFNEDLIKKFREDICKPYFAKELNSSQRELKVFIVRKSLHRNSDLSLLQDMLERTGFLSIDPAKLTLGEQAEIFGRAKIVVGAAGANWANMIFCREGTQIINLCDEKLAPASIFGHLAHIFNLEFKSVGFPSLWKAQSHSHWLNTPEAFLQSGFYADKNLSTSAYQEIIQ